MTQSSKIFFAAAFAYLAILWVGVGLAYGQQRQMIPAICMPIEAADKLAREQFKEHPVAQGVIVEGDSYIVMYHNPQTKGFSIMSMTKSTGIACIIAAGDNWQAIKDQRSDL